MQVLTHLTTTLKLSTTAVTFYLTLTLTLNPLYISAAPLKPLNRRSISNDPLPLLAKVHTNLTTTTTTAAISQLNKFKEEKESEFPLPVPALAPPRPSPSLSIHTPPLPMPITTSNNLEDLTEPVNILNDFFIANSVKPGDTCIPPKTGEEEKKEGDMRVCNGGDVLMRCVGMVWEVDMDCGVAGYGCGAAGVQDFGNGGWKVDVRCLPKGWL